MADTLELIIKATNLTSDTMAKVAAEVGALGDASAAANAKIEETSLAVRDATAANLGQLASTGSVTRAFGQDLEGVGKSATALGRSLVPMSLGAAVGIGFAAKAAIDFNQQMERLHTLGGLSQATVDGLNSKILEMAPAVGIGPDKLAEAMYHIASNSKGLLPASEMLDLLKVSAEAASIAGANLDDTTYALSSALATGITGAKNASEMMGVLTATVGAGDMKFQDLNAAIGSGFFATAAQFGISVQSVGAALATLTDNGMHADEAATRLRMSVSLMAAPSGQAAKVLHAMGLSGAEVTASTAAATEELAKAHVTTTQLADDMRKPNGINVAMKDLRDHLESTGLSADAADSAIAKAFGGGRSDAAILTLLNNVKRTDESFAKINKDSTHFADTWAAQQQTAAQKMNDFKAAVDVLGVKLGNALLPTLTSLAKELQGLVTWFSNLSPHTQDMIVKLGLIVAIGAPTLIFFGSLITAVTSLGPLFSVTGMALRGLAGLFAPQAATMIGQIGFVKFAALGLQATIATPIAFVLGIAAALAALAYLMSKVQETKAAIAGLDNSRAAFNQTSSGLAAAAAKLPAGPERDRMLALARTPAPAMPNLGLAGWLSGQYASGTNNAPGGLALVGEEGPELVQLPQGSKVYTNSQSQSMMKSGGGDVHLTVNVGTFTGTTAEFDTLASKIYQSLMRTARANGTQLPAIGIRPS